MTLRQAFGKSNINILDIINTLINMHYSQLLVLVGYNHYYILIITKEFVRKATKPERSVRAMPTPSVQLLRALRATEVIRACIPLRQQAGCPIQNLSFQRKLLPSANALRPHTRPLSTSSTPGASPPIPQNKSTDRGPKSTEATQTDFGAMDVFSNAPAPTASIDACLSDGFHLDNGVKIGDGSGLLLVSGEAFSWRPWEAGGRGRLLNQRGQWDTGDGAWGVLGLVWPKPGMGILLQPKGRTRVLR